MEYLEAVARLNQLKIALGSGLKGAQYKAVLAEYMALKRAIAQARAQGAGQQAQSQPQESTEGGGGGGSDEWWMNRGSGNWSLL